VPQSPEFDPADAEQRAHIVRLLDWAQRRGMKLIVCDRRGYAKSDAADVAPGYADGVRAAVKDFGSHPALFGFHVGDEPDKALKAAFFESYRIQKEVAPGLHPFANLLPYWPGAERAVGARSWAEYLDDYVKRSHADLLSYDCYAQMNPGTEGQQMYYRNLRLYREAAVRNGVPFWNTILSVGHFRYRVPSLDDIRWQFNTTLLLHAGAGRELSRRAGGRALAPQSDVGLPAAGADELSPALRRPVCAPGIDAGELLSGSIRRGTGVYAGRDRRADSA